MTFDPAAARGDFPGLSAEENGRPFLYLDSAATMQMPWPVAEAVLEQELHCRANVHRGIYARSERATARMEAVRGQVRRMLNAASADEVIFTSGTTQSINAAALAFAAQLLAPGDEVLVTELDHHSNYLPWQAACARAGAVFRTVPVDRNGEVTEKALRGCLTPRTRLAAFPAVSNVTGTVTDVAALTAAAHEAGAYVLVDAAQAFHAGVPDVQRWGCDLLAFSGHKLGAPMGVGVLWGRQALLSALPPAFFGGGMADTVRPEGSTFLPAPLRFEAGTPNVGGIVGLGAALDYLEAIGWEEANAHEHRLLRQAEEGLRAIPGVTVLGAPARRAGALSFNVRGLHCFDVAALLDALGIAVRSGHHCAQPLLRALGADGAVRISPALYNTEEEIGHFLAAVRRIAALGEGAEP